jgi:chaperone required for assembly of F1-ATPase
VKRFWKQAAAVPDERGWSVEIDGKPLRTPARKPLVVPAEKLARAIADEWSAAGQTVDPGAMPLTGLANAAIDRVATDPNAFAASLARYGESDLACYRADNPRELAGRQAKSWDELLAWARRRFDIDFCTTSGILHVQQPEPTIRRLAQAVASFDPFRLAALSPLVTISGSLVAALAVTERQLSPEQAWHAVTIDEQWQREQWGPDADAEAALEARWRDFFAAARFLELLDG